MPLNSEHDFPRGLQIETGAGKRDWIRVVQGFDSERDRESDWLKLLAQDVVADQAKRIKEIVTSHGESEVIRRRKNTFDTLLVVDG